MAYKVNDQNIIIDSDGKFVLITDSEVLFTGSTTIGNTLYDLSEDYFRNTFVYLQGDVAGYRTGGYNGTNPTSTIDKYPFASDANATATGDMIDTRVDNFGAFSPSHGYVAGGFRTYPPFNPPYSTNRIEKFPFSVDADTTDVANLVTNTSSATGLSSPTHGYAVGGANPPPSAHFNSITKYPFSADANATNVGNLINTLDDAGRTGCMNNEAGYVNGGQIPPNTDIIQKFSFVTDGNAVQVGNLTSTRYNSSGSSSTSHGYVSGGYGPIWTNAIEKYGFVTEGTATDVGDLTDQREDGASASSTVSGYTAGGSYGSNPGVNYKNIIDKFPFSSDTNATDVGDLTQTVNRMAGQQV